MQDIPPLYFLLATTQYRRGNGPRRHALTYGDEPICGRQGRFRCNGTEKLVQWAMGDITQGTYDLGGKASVIGEADNGVVEIVHVSFVDGLKLVKKIQETKAECGLWVDEGRREELRAQQLPATVSAVSRRTCTIANHDLMDTGEVEDGKLVTRRGVWAALANRVTQLEDKAEGGKGLFSKVVPIPPLQIGQNGNEQPLNK